MTDHPPIPNRRPPWLQLLAAMVVAAFLGWCCFMGAAEVLESLRTGVLDNRKGPDLRVAEHPLWYWTLISFYVAATLTAAGMALVVLAIALRDFWGGARRPAR